MRFQKFYFLQYWIRATKIQISPDFFFHDCWKTGHDRPLKSSSLCMYGFGRRIRTARYLLKPLDSGVATDAL